MKKTIASIIAATILTGCATTTNYHGGHTSAQKFETIGYETLTRAENLDDVISSNVANIKYNAAIRDINSLINRRQESEVRRKVHHYANQFASEGNYKLEKRMEDFTYQRMEKVGTKYKDEEKVDGEMTWTGAAIGALVPPLGLLLLWDSLDGGNDWNKSNTREVIKPEHCRTVEINPYHNTEHIISEYKCK